MVKLPRHAASGLARRRRDNERVHLGHLGALGERVRRCGRRRAHSNRRTRRIRWSHARRRRYALRERRHLRATPRASRAVSATRTHGTRWRRMARRAAREEPRAEQGHNRHRGRRDRERPSPDRRVHVARTYFARFPKWRGGGRDARCRATRSRANLGRQRDRGLRGARRHRRRGAHRRVSLPRVSPADLQVNRRSRTRSRREAHWPFRARLRRSRRSLCARTRVRGR